MKIVEQAIGEKTWIETVDGKEVRTHMVPFMLKMESWANVEPEANEQLIYMADCQTIASRLASIIRDQYRGDFSKFATEPTAGKQFWYDGEVVRLNPDFRSNERGAGGKTKADVLVEMATDLAKIRGTSIVAEINKSAADKKTKEAALLIAKSL